MDGWPELPGQLRAGWPWAVHRLRVRYQQDRDLRMAVCMETVQAPMSVRPETVWRPRGV